MRERLRCWTFVAAASLAACTGGEPTTGQGEAGPAAAAPVSRAEGVEIQFRSRPDPPASGENTFEVTVRAADGSPVDGASVTAVFFMPAMPSMNMPAMKTSVTLVPQGSGRYEGTGQLSMGGTWQVTVTVTRGADEIGRRELSVVAR
jgi:hypothetical protein